MCHSLTFKFNIEGGCHKQCTANINQLNRSKNLLHCHYILQCHFYMPNFYSLPSHTYKMPLTNYTNIFGPSFSSYYSLEMQCSICVYLWVNLTGKTKLGTKDAIPWQGELLWQCKERFPSQLKQFKSKAKYTF